MKKFKTVHLFLFFLFLNGYSQNTLKITFASKPNIKIEHLQKLDKEIQEITLKQLQKTSFVETMQIDNKYVYFETKPQTKEETKEGALATKIVNGSLQTTRALTTTMNSPANKYRKNKKENTYTQKIDKKLVTKNLPTLTWELSKKTKKILGYHCLNAVGKYDNKIIEIYFTTELHTKASPELIPFIDGVVLEYNNGFMSGIATKIEKNQPAITHFFKK